MSPRTLVDKVWDAHLVTPVGSGEELLFVDRNFLHDLTVRIVVPDLERRGHAIREPGMTFAVSDHAVSTLPGRNGAQDERALEFGTRTRQLAERAGITYFGLATERQGIVHVIGPELGLTQPGLTIVCTDSHTCTHGALGALAFGIGTTEAAHVAATQTTIARRPRTMRVTLDGTPQPGVGAKDVILALIGRYGAAAGTGYAVEFDGSYVRAVGMEERMTICNMAIEFGARTGIVAPDDTTFDYLAGRDFAPRGTQWDRAVAHWRGLPSDEAARFDAELALDVAALDPQVSWGTSVDQIMPITGRVPGSGEDDAGGIDQRAAHDYIGLMPGTPIEGVAIDWAFIGSCANGRFGDLRSAAAIMRGRKIAPGVRALVVPGSTAVRRAAEREGLDKVFIAAGAEWREAGCSLCCAVNGDVVGSGERCISTSNRNFIGRQGPGSRTHLASPAMVAAAAVTGCITDVRRLGPL